MIVPLIEDLDRVHLDAGFTARGAVAFHSATLTNVRDVREC